MTAEIERLQAELSQAHALNRQVAARLDEVDKGRAAEGAEAARVQAELSASLGSAAHERDSARDRVQVLASEQARQVASVMLGQPTSKPLAASLSELKR